MAIATHAQTWQGIVNYNGYSCFSLSSLFNYSVLVAKGTDDGGHELLNVKFKTPYHWSNTGSACVKIIQTDLSFGNRSTEDSYLHYKNGWVYVSHYTYNNKPVYSYIVTVYKNNDFGKSRGESRTYNLHIDKLNATRLPMSNKAFETYW